MEQSLERLIQQAVVKVQQFEKQQADKSDQSKIYIKILNELLKEQVQNARTHNSIG